MVTIVLYSIIMMGAGSSIQEWKKNNDDEIVKFAYKTSSVIIAVVCIIAWLLLP